MVYGLKFNKIVLIAAVAGGILLGCDALLKKGDTLICSHKAHADKNVKCLDCHTRVDGSTSAAADNLPRMKDCGKCHLKEATSNCSYCHTDPKNAVGLKADFININFSHYLHMRSKLYDCDTCHKPAAGAAGGKDVVMPDMKRCFKCHQQKYDNYECRYCHFDMYRFDLEKISSFSHGGNYAKRHGQMGREKQELCRQCHVTSYCAGCHVKNESLKPDLKNPEKVDRNFIHRGDYRGRHGLDAGAEPGTCVKCHENSYCVKCHERERVAERSKPAAGAHPSGWMERSSGDFHGGAARRNIAGCASCHERNGGTNCLACHRTGRSPHPGGWKPGINKSADPACRQCHGR
jgi:predicted CXXCH cytochrome family protein